MPSPWVMLIAFVVLMIFGIGFLAVWTEHLQKMAQMRATGGSRESSELGRQIADLREELSRLRETATQYDLSFDQTLQRLEQRIAAIERHPAAMVGQDVDTVQVRQRDAS
ncbi:MAG TPA: hypothetical protein VLH79_16195 [Chthonomonadales bacterium]|nr:hypothetical protein [Chthonomonadales bacterium]